MKLPEWLHFSWGDSVFRGRAFGSRRTVLHLLVLSAERGPNVWMLCALGWCLSVGPEDGLAEGRFAAKESTPGFRARTLWRFKSGREIELSYAPRNQEGGEGRG